MHMKKQIFGYDRLCCRLESKLRPKIYLVNIFYTNQINEQIKGKENETKPGALSGYNMDVDNDIVFTILLYEVARRNSKTASNCMHP